MGRIREPALAALCTAAHPAPRQIPLPGGGAVWAHRRSHDGASHLAGRGLAGVCLVRLEFAEPVGRSAPGHAQRGREFERAGGVLAPADNPPPSIETGKNGLLSPGPELFPTGRKRPEGVRAGESGNGYPEIACVRCGRKRRERARLKARHTWQEKTQYASP